MDPAGIASGFRDELRGFVDRHWAGGARGETARAAWFEALVARGWSVPRWPVAYGGTGWDAAAQHLWAEETARAGVPEMDAAGTALIGPLLIAAGSRAQRDDLLPAIREARSTWCVAFLGGNLEVRARGSAAALTGTLEAVPGAARADRLLCAVGDDRLALVDLSGVGVRRRVLAGLDGAAGSATLTFSGVAVAADRWLDVGARDALDLLAPIPGAWPLRASRERARLDALRDLAVRTIGGAPLDDLEGRLAALEVALLGLEALERRALDAQARGGWSAPRAALIGLRQMELAEALGVLTRDLLGYHSLPFPDPRLIDNEGPIGHDGALALVAQALARPGTPLDDVTGAFHKNTIARSLLGP